MILTPTRRRGAMAAAALAATLGLLGAACGSSSKSSTGTSSTTPAVKLAPATLNASGSTFQQAYDQEVIKAFTAKNAGITINYGGGGSGKGLQDLQGKLVDFAGSDAPIATADLPKYAGGVLYFPTVAAPITVSYNLSGVSKVTLGPSTIAKIFSGTIKSWSDPAITADNGSALPNKPITTVHRSDGSGTTNNFTLYLKKADPTDWTYGSSKSWPAALTGQAGNGNAGVAQVIKQTDGAVGYVDFSDARAVGLSFASVKNSSGQAIDPSLDAASAAVAGATVNADLTYDPTNASGADAYPITSPTWIIIYKTQTDKAKGEALKAFLAFILKDGQQSLAKDNDFAPLSPDLDQKASAQLDQIVIPQ